MTAPTARRRRTRQVILATACLLAAVAAATALDRGREARRRRSAVGGRPLPGRSSLTMPTPAQWRATPLPVGRPAPPLDLADVKTGQRVRLDDYRGTPVVLVFGSFGCNALCSQWDGLVRLHRDYEGRAAFLFVAVRDAGHPDARTAAMVGGPLPAGAPQEDVVRVLRRGLEGYGIRFPCLLDEDGAAERAYDAFPKRLVVVGADGRVAYDGGRGASGGPSDWDLAAAGSCLRAAIRAGVERPDGVGRPGGKHAELHARGAREWWAMPGEPRPA